MKYLNTSELPRDKEEARKVRNSAESFTVINGVMYKRGFSEPLLKCVLQDEAQYILAEVHEGVCGSHSGGRALAAKVMKARYYLPHALRDVRSARCTLQSRNATIRDDVNHVSMVVCPVGVASSWTTSFRQRRSKVCS